MLGVGKLLPTGTMPAKAPQERGNLGRMARGGREQLPLSHAGD